MQETRQLNECILLTRAIWISPTGYFTEHGLVLMSGSITALVLDNDDYYMRQEVAYLALSNIHPNIRAITPIIEDRTNANYKGGVKYFIKDKQRISWR